MLICFGFSWPFAIIKTVKVKNPAGKSYIFLGLIIVGYIAGCIYKLTGTFDFVFYLYLLNGLLVSTDTVLCLYYQHRNRKKIYRLCTKHGLIKNSARSAYSPAGATRTCSNGGTLVAALKWRRKYTRSVKIASNEAMPLAGSDVPIK